MKWYRCSPSPSMAVSLTALFVALGGTGYAAFSLPKNAVGTKQLKNGAVSTAKLQNGAVTKNKLNVSGVSVPLAQRAGIASTAASAASANHAGSADRATSADHAISADSATNAAHASNAGHANTADSATTATGLGPLAAGQTERGDWGLWDVGPAPLGSAVTFPIPLAAGLDSSHVHVIAPSTAAPPGCAGGTSSSPQAASGNLCVYEAVANNISTGGVFSQSTGASNTADPFGFGFEFNGGSGVAVIYGTWAVTG